MPKIPPIFRKSSIRISSIEEEGIEMMRKSPW
jgi:hypothetical protein